MTSNIIYTPFTYCITFIPTGQRYYGSRYANNKKEMAHPSQLWTTYFTSSKIIFDLIEEHGKDAFIFEVRKTFKTKEETVSWESKFLTKIGAAQSPKWLNGHNGGSTFHSTTESIQKAKDTRKKNGIFASQTPESIQKAKDTKKERGIEPPMKNPDTVQKRKDTCKEKGTGMDNPSIIQKCKDTKKERSIEHPMKNQETIQKTKDTKLKNGTTNPNTPESIQKRKNTLEKNGGLLFLSLIETRKTYAKSNLSRWYPEFKIFY